eukprot:c6182_g1_i2.p1 GENE.c6182_g1_i2~~c6182_g1_i2.p1  ORF type:complete len:434 (-),score=122.88 c6182_g1_i2:59-1258(-)
MSTTTIETAATIQQQQQQCLVQEAVVVGCLGVLWCIGLLGVTLLVVAGGFGGVCADDDVVDDDDDGDGMFGMRQRQIPPPPLPSDRMRVVLGLVLGTVTAVVVSLWHVLNENPLVWLIERIVLQRVEGVGIVVFWVMVTPASLLFISWWNSRNGRESSLPQILMRKYFHVVAVVLFTPAILLHATLFHVALCVALSLMLVAETVRLAGVPHIAPHVHAFMSPFVDKRDGGRVILTHIYLLLGCLFPVCLDLFCEVANKHSLANIPHPTPPSPAQQLHVTHNHKQVMVIRHITRLIGVMALGIGDSLASACGRRFGRTKWIGTCKTVEGTVAGAAGTVVAVMLPVMAVCGIGAVTMFQFAVVAVAVVLGFCVEACTKHIDNLVLPLFLFSAISVLANLSS